jgi:inosose dehydratase
VNWNNADVPDFREWTPWPRMLDEMVEAGFTATEWGPGMPEDAEVLREALATRGLAMVGAYVGFLFRDADRHAAELERALEVARRLNATGGTLLIAADAGDERRREEAGHVDEANGLTDAQWANLVDGLHALAEAVAALGLRVVFHNHVGTYVETAAETARLLDATDPAKVAWCMDIGHLTYGGGDVLAMLERYGDRVEHVHLKDVDGWLLERARAEAWPFADGLQHYIFPPLGEGIARVGDVIDALAARGYDGWLVPEQDTCAGDPKAIALANREFIERRLAAAAARG